MLLAAGICNFLRNYATSNYQKNESYVINIWWGYLNLCHQCDFCCCFDTAAQKNYASPEAKPTKSAADPQGPVWRLAVLWAANRDGARRWIDANKARNHDVTQRTKKPPAEGWFA